jgi:hypothetical protein
MISRRSERALKSCGGMAPVRRSIMIGGRTDGPQPYNTGTRPEFDGKARTPPAIRRAVWR